ncbi:MAG: sensor histidine kinase [Rhodothermales bacterium]
MLNPEDTVRARSLARPLGRHPLVMWGIAFAGVTVLLLLISGQGYIFDAMRERNGQPFWERILWPSFFWYSWALLVPFIFMLARRFPFAQAHWRKSVLVHLGGCAAFFVIHVAGQVAAMYTPLFDHIHSDFLDALSYHIITSIDTNILVYGLIAGIAHAFTYYQRYRQRELKAVQLESELARARLQALKTQLHPHFLFNTLHSISTLMYRDVRAADRMLARLSELLRLTLESSDAQEVPLRDEVAFLEKYLHIEQIRLGDRLTVAFDVDPAVEDALVPNLVLQPLVENAVKHGIAPRSAPGRIEIHAWAENGHLRLRVADDGLGMSDAPASAGTGIGLANVQARLEHLYGEAHRLRLRPAQPTGLIVDVTLPLRWMEEEEAAAPVAPLA